MAALNIVGPHQPGGHPPEVHEHGGQSGVDPGHEDPARADRIAELAARLAAIESRDRRAEQPTPPGGSTGTELVEKGSVSTVGLDKGSVSTVGLEKGPVGTVARAGSWASVPIGSSGSTDPTNRRHAEPGGHPEDAPGNPEAVAKAICLRLLTGAARPRAGLATALRQRGIADDVAAKVLDRFVAVGLIDDGAYAAAFVAAKHRDRALGVTALRTELRRKGIDEVTVDAAVQVVNSDAERDRARELISRRVDAAMSNGFPAARRRLIGLLARRGYSAEMSGKLVDEALAEYGADQGPSWLD